MNSLKVFLATATLMFFGFCQPALAQAEVSPIRNGDKAMFDFITYGQRGREVYEANKSTTSGQFEITDGSITIKYGDGRADKFDKDMGLVSGPSMGLAEANKSTSVFRWKPSEMSSGKKPAVSYSFLSSICGSAQIALKDVMTREGSRVISTKGKELKIPVTEIIFDGNWSASCGGGKYRHEIAYSSELGQVVEIKTFNYQPNGFLHLGSAVKLISLE